MCYKETERQTVQSTVVNVLQAKMAASFDFDTVDLDITPELQVLEFVVSKTVGEMHHVAVR